MKKPRPNLLIPFTVIVTAVFFVFSLVQLNFEYSKLWSGADRFVNMVTKMFPPSPKDWEHVLAAALESLQVALVGTVLAILFSFFLGFLSARNMTPNRTVMWLTRMFAGTMRAIPTLIWALIFIVSVGMGPIAGIMALAIHSIGMLVKVFSESVEEVDSGKIEAMRATGANWLQIVMQGVLPMVSTAYLSWSLFRLEIDIRYSTILGMVGAGGIGWELTRAMRMYKLDEAMFITLVIFFMIFAVELAGDRVKKSLLRI